MPLECMGAHAEGLALPKSVDTGKLGLNKFVVQWMSV
jgi:hypothetical protein